jgi:hypothetical protein
MREKKKLHIYEFVKHKTTSSWNLQNILNISKISIYNLILLTVDLIYWRKLKLYNLLIYKIKSATLESRWNFKI